MQIRYNTTTAQTLSPIVIDVTQSPGRPQITVTPASNGVLETFTVPVKEIGAGFYQAQFWLERPGDYAVTVQAQEITQSERLQIRQHQFLPFGAEFGLFITALALAFGGLWLWRRGKNRP